MNRLINITIALAVAIVFILGFTYSKANLIYSNTDTTYQPVLNSYVQTIDIINLNSYWQPYLVTKFNPSLGTLDHITFKVSRGALDWSYYVENLDDKNGCTIIMSTVSQSNVTFRLVPDEMGIYDISHTWTWPGPYSIPLTAYDGNGDFGGSSGESIFYSDSYTNSTGIDIYAQKILESLTGTGSDYLLEYTRDITGSGYSTCQNILSGDDYFEDAVVKITYWYY